MRLVARTLMAAGFALATAGVALAQQVTLRVMWYSDGIEGDVVRDLLNSFEKQNPSIKVNLDRVPYKTIVEQLPPLLDSGQGPDLARVTDLGGLSRHYLDIKPMVKDAKYWEDNLGTTLAWLRPAGNKDGIFGAMTQLALTMPFVNATLFQQAGIAIPGPTATWDDWAKAAVAVAKKTGAPYPIAMDRSGHRMAGPAISMGAKILKGDKPALLDDGFKAISAKLVAWHKDGVMPKALWGSVGGATYRGANEEFANGQVVLYMSGNWQIPQFAEKIGKAFDWHAVPNPCGPAACTGMPGGAALVALKATKHPKEVAALLDWFASEPVQSEYHARTFFLPAHKGLATKGVPYKSEVEGVTKSLAVAVGQVAKISPIAFAYQGYEHNRILFNTSIVRINQAINGEMSLDDAFKRMQADIVEGFAAKGIKVE